MSWDAEDAEADRWERSAWPETGKRWRDLVESFKSVPIMPDAEDVEGREGDIVSTGQESGMSNREARKNLLRKRIELAEKNLAKAREELAKLDRPEEPWKDSTSATPLIAFDFRFHGSSKVYQFSGLRIPEIGKWYLTGGAIGHAPKTWEELMVWIEEHGTLVGPIRLSTSYRNLS